MNTAQAPMPDRPVSRPPSATSRILSRKRYLAAGLSGLLLTAAFPPFPLPWLAWIALVPLLAGLHGAGPREAFRLGFAAGMVHYLTLIYWIVVVLGHYGGLPILASLVPLVLLCGLMALYIALFGAASVLFRRALAAGLFGALAWTGLEYIRTVFMTGFPWCLLGYSQYNVLSAIQIADLFGVYGVSFLVVLVNIAAFRLCVRLKNGAKAPLPLGLALLAAACLVSVLLYGRARLQGLEPGGEAGEPLRCAVVQGNIDQSVKWDPAYQERTLAVYERLSLDAAGFDPDLVVWPETAVPFFFQESEELAERVYTLADALGGALLFGSPAYERTAGSIRYLNRAYLVDPAARSIGRYDKVHLVPFGEYVPLRRLLFFVQRLVPAAGDFSPGESLSPLAMGELSLGVLICFEAIFPDLARRLCMQGTDVLVNLTNDAWFGRTSAPYQHLAMAAFRAVENRRPMLRAANTGISAVVLPTGQIEARSPLFEEALLTAVLGVTPPEPPVYTRIGDLFALLSLFGAGLSVAWRVWAGRRGVSR